LGGHSDPHNVPATRFQRLGRSHVRGNTSGSNPGRIAQRHSWKSDV
jgi:hypothetical protein